MNRYRCPACNVDVESPGTFWHCVACDHHVIVPATICSSCKGPRGKSPLAPPLDVTGDFTAVVDAERRNHAVATFVTQLIRAGAMSGSMQAAGVFEKAEALAREAERRGLLPLFSSSLWEKNP